MQIKQNKITEISTNNSYDNQEHALTELGLNQDSENEQKKTRKYIISGIIWFFTLLLVGFCFIMAGKVGTKAQEVAEKKASAIVAEKPKTNVIIMQLQPKPIRDSINLPGIVTPWVKLNVATEVMGIVTKKNIKAGDVVKKGDVIVTIDSRKYRNHFLSLKASHESAKSAQKRLASLSKSKLAKKSDIDSVNAQVKSLEAQMENARLDIEHCTVKSPISGVINAVMFEKGQNMNMSDPVVEIIQTDKVKVRVGIPESDVNAVRKLNRFDIKIDALDGKEFQGKKYFLSKTADSFARLYNLDIEIDNVNNEILPDMFARVEIVKKENEEALSVPLFSIMNVDNNNVVYVVNDDSVHARKVKTGMQEGWKVEIIEGLSPNDKVIVTGQRSVSDGQVVNIVREVSELEELNR